MVSTLPQMQAKRFARVYAGRSFYVVKPDERRHWRPSDAQADVQQILDDHFRRRWALPIDELDVPGSSLRQEIATTH